MSEQQENLAAVRHTRRLLNAVTVSGDDVPKLSITMALLDQLITLINQAVEKEIEDGKVPEATPVDPIGLAAVKDSTENSVREQADNEAVPAV